MAQIDDTLLKKVLTEMGLSSDKKTLLRVKLLLSSDNRGLINETDIRRGLNDNSLGEIQVLLTAHGDSITKLTKKVIPEVEKMNVPMKHQK